MKIWGTLAIILLCLFERSLSQPYYGFPPIVKIFNRTVYWGCDDVPVPSSFSPDLPFPPDRGQKIYRANCSEALDAPLKSCEVMLPENEFYLFMHHPSGMDNYFHAWANDYLPLLKIVLASKGYQPKKTSRKWEVHDSLDERFVQLIERPFKVLTFENERHHPHYVSGLYPHIDFLLTLLEKDPIHIDDNKVYCFPEKAEVFPAWLEMLRLKIMVVANSKGLVWQTQLYVRERLFGLEDNHERGKKQLGKIDRKPVLLWVERSKGTPRYLHSWRDILSQLSSGFDVRLLNAEKILSPRKLVELMDDVDILLGVHGAGLQNMVWMRPYHSIVEIRWPLQKKPDRNYFKMSQHLEHFYSEVECYHLDKTEFSIGPMPLKDQKRIVEAVEEAWIQLKSSLQSNARDEL